MVLFCIFSFRLIEELRLFFWLQGTIALPTCTRVGLCVWAFAGACAAVRCSVLSFFIFLFFFSSKYRSAYPSVFFNILSFLKLNIMSNPIKIFGKEYSVGKCYKYFKVGNSLVPVANFRKNKSSQIYGFCFQKFDDSWHVFDIRYLPNFDMDSMKKISYLEGKLEFVAAYLDSQNITDFSFFGSDSSVIGAISRDDLSKFLGDNPKSGFESRIIYAN
jgi:hypothetical protein